MSRDILGISTCPFCNRAVRTAGNRYGRHSITPGKKPDDQRDTCPLTGQRVPITGDEPSAYVSRAHLVADLADQVQDQDPAIVWHYLTSLPAAEVQRLLVLALAAIPVADRKVEDIWDWVTELPIAKAVTA